MNKLYQIQKNNRDIIKTLLTNTAKMLTERKLLKRNDLEQNINYMLKTPTGNMIWKIKTVKDTFVAIKIIREKITAISRAVSVNDFLNKYKNDHKIIIIKEINKKAAQTIKNNNPGTEIFFEEELMINIIDHDLVPQHIPLSKEESEEMLRTYLCKNKKKNLPKIYDFDPVVRYLNLKPGTIVKILRPSDNAGVGVFYRLVVHGQPKK